MNEINSLTFYRSFYEAIKNLDENQRLKIYDAIFEYQFDKKDIQFEDKILQSFWLLIQPNIDSSNSKKLAGAKGGRPRKNQKKASFSKNKNLAFQKTKTEEEVEVEEEVEGEVDVDKESDAFLQQQQQNPVFDFYLNNINSLPVEKEVDIIESYQKELPDNLIIYAMQKAVENKARNLAYIKGILNKWIKKGITTLSEAQEEKSDKEEQGIKWSGFLKRHAEEE